ncbi:SDR family NAD(P)-dependent oxidoreductase [Sphaerisporangium sp. TRM90804]|uniref:SDR family NAD(P)-dependent oxidoreductase n=1 Tax=Sphaerisporangium sp. TRM90804 TaxID=3031113 RepID=UPI002446F41D|nr:SDR family NAD(P)-dependent oxidoreductase [Sphaerisporangium sp. TRM90804]MDH2426161.1 SDR family NAD(P)-dependent oxidoreductase [Sphaerisporangium sp. TRM90804]
MRSYVVTGGGRGIGRAVAERLLGDGGAVVVLEAGPVPWAELGTAGGRVAVVAGDAADEAVAERAAARAGELGVFTGWVNNAAVFGDASVHTAPARAVLDLVAANLDAAIVGSAAAVRRFLSAGTGGAIVNVSSHQARRAVAGCLPYVTAKAAVEGLTRALAVEYGPRGIRANAVAPGSVDTERYRGFVAGLEAGAAARVERRMRQAHPLGRVARAAEVAAVIVHLLSAEASFVTGATVPVDGGRSVLALDPESAAAPGEER